MINTVGARLPDSSFGRRSVPASETFAPSNLISFDSKDGGEEAVVGDELFLFWAAATTTAPVKINSEVVILINHFIRNSWYSRFLSHQYTAFAKVLLRFADGELSEMEDGSGERRARFPDG